MDNQIQWLTEHGFKVTVNSSVPPDVILIITPSHPHSSPLVPESTSLAEYLVLANGPFEIQVGNSIFIDLIATTLGGPVQRTRSYTTTLKGGDAMKRGGIKNRCPLPEEVM